jgi:hypothetical protein
MYSTVNIIVHFSYFDSDYLTSRLTVTGLTKVYYTDSDVPIVFCTLLLTEKPYHTFLLQDPKFLFRLYMARHQYREAAKTAIIVASQEQINGTNINMLWCLLCPSVVHQVFATCCQLKSDIFWWLTTLTVANLQKRRLYWNRHFKYRFSWIAAIMELHYMIVMIIILVLTWTVFLCSVKCRMAHTDLKVVNAVTSSPCWELYCKWEIEKMQHQWEILTETDYLWDINMDGKNIVIFILFWGSYFQFVTYSLDISWASLICLLGLLLLLSARNLLLVFHCTVS